MKKKSSHINNMNYNKDTKTLEITFHNGAVYSYKDVPEKAYNELHSADSHGKHFIANIKNAFQGTKIK